MANVLKRFRSAITGRFVSRKQAEKQSRTTVSETVKKADKKPGA